MLFHCTERERVCTLIFANKKKQIVYRHKYQNRLSLVFLFYFISLFPIHPPLSYDFFFAVHCGGIRFAHKNRSLRVLRGV